MSKGPFEDPELQAMRASMRPASAGVRWGRVVTGVVIVAFATFAFGYYLPLRRAHEMLTARFGELRASVDATKRTTEEARKRAEQLAEELRATQGKLGPLEERDKAGAAAGSALKSALEPKLQKAIAGGQTAVGTLGNQAVVSLSFGSLLARGKLELSPPGKANLCAIASAAKPRSIRVRAVAGKKDIPAALAAKLKTPLEHNLAVAQLVSQALLDQCKVDPTTLSAAGVPSEAAATPKLEGKQLSGPRVELWLEGA